MRLLWSWLLLVGTATVAVAADPFYLARLRDGEAALARADHRSAAKELRLACFGLLDEPDQLGRCLVSLALAEARAGETVALERTFQRLLEAEALAGAWRLAALDPTLRSAFADEVGRALPEALLQDSAIFGDLLAARRRAEVAGLSGRAREKALRERIGRQPGVAFWSEELALFELENGDPTAAREILAGLSARGAGTRRTPCLEGQVAFALREWSIAASALARCSEGGSQLLLVEALIEAGQVDEARRHFDALALEVREQPRAASIAARLPAAQSPAQPANEPAPPPAEELSALRLRLSSASETKAVAEVGRAAEDLASASGLPEAWLLAAEAAYRLSQWERAVRLFDSGGPPSTPEQGFYLAVALFETGQLDAARLALEPVLPRLRRTPYVETMVGKIRGAS